MSYSYKSTDISNMLVPGDNSNSLTCGYSIVGTDLLRTYKINNFTTKFDIYQNGIGYNGSNTSFLPVYYDIIPPMAVNTHSTIVYVIPDWCNKIKCIIIAQGGGVNTYNYNGYSGGGSAGVFEYNIPAHYIRSNIQVFAFGKNTGVDDTYSGNGHTGLTLKHDPETDRFVYIPNGTYGNYVDNIGYIGSGGGNNGAGDNGDINRIYTNDFTKNEFYIGEDGYYRSNTNDNGNYAALCGFVRSSKNHDNLGFDSNYYGRGFRRNYPVQVGEQSGFIRIYFLA